MMDADWGLSSDGCLPDFIEYHARWRPYDRALIFGDTSLTWAEFEVKTRRFAALLKSFGIGPGDRVAFLSGNSGDYVLGLFGTVRRAACFVPLPTSLTVMDTAHMVADCGARLLMHDRENGQKAEAVLDELPSDRDRPSALLFEDLWAQQEPEESGVVSMAEFPDEAFDIIYSSGTTGVPKGIQHGRAQRMKEYAAAQTFGFGTETVGLVATPIYSNLTMTIILPALMFGGAVAVMPKFDEAEFLRISERERVTNTTLVPVQYERLLVHPHFDKTDLSSYRIKLATGAPLRPEVKRDIVKRWPGKFIEIYGMTEGGVTCILDATAYPDKLDSVGLPGPGCDVRIVGEDDREVDPGINGEIVGHSEMMTKGYLNRQEATIEASWYDDEGNRYQRSGDIGWRDEDGFIHVVDRKKDVIISGGFNIYASDLEQVLMDHPAVVECSVIAKADDKWGETPVGFVVLSKTDDITADELKNWANDQLGKFQRLSDIRVIDELPRNAAGKVLKQNLRALIHS